MGWLHEQKMNRYVVKHTCMWYNNGRIKLLVHKIFLQLSCMFEIFHSKILDEEETLFKITEIMSIPFTRLTAWAWVIPFPLTK